MLLGPWIVSLYTSVSQSRGSASDNLKGSLLVVAGGRLVAVAATGAPRTCLLITTLKSNSTHNETDGFNVKVQNHAESILFLHTNKFLLTL